MAAAFAGEMVPLQQPEPHVIHDPALAPAAAQALWIHTNHARLAKKHAANKTRVHTLKFISPLSCPTRGTGTASGSAGDTGRRSSGSTTSPSSEIRIEMNQQEWPLTEHIQEEQTPPVRSLDEEEAKENHSHDRADRKGGGSTRRPRRNIPVPLSADDHCAGSLPAIVVDPFCSLLNPACRPHIVPDATMKNHPLPPAPAPAIWSTDYARHTVRCVLADGQIHTVAGAGSVERTKQAAQQVHLDSSVIPAAPPVSDAAMPGYADGTGTLSALFAKPRGLVLHPLTGEMFIADSANHCIRSVTSPMLVANALKRAGRAIEDASTFRTLRDPTADPKEEEERELKRRRKARPNAAVSTSIFPTPELAASLRIVLSLFQPLIVDYVGFEVRTVAGTPGMQGLRDTSLDSSGRVEKEALFKFPIGMCLRMVGVVGEEVLEEDGNERATGTVADDDTDESRLQNRHASDSNGSSVLGSSPPRPSGLSHLRPASPSYPTPSGCTFELLVSDAGNGCVRRIKPNPFSPFASVSPKRVGSPERNGFSDQDSSSLQHSFIVETLHAYVPVRCCHTAWSSNNTNSNSSQDADANGNGGGNQAVASHEKVEESKDNSTSSPTHSPSPGSFASTLLENLSQSPARLLRAEAREYITFLYPIGLALKVEKRAGQELKEMHFKYGSVWTVDVPISSSTGSNGLASGGSDDAPSPAAFQRLYAPSCTLIVVDARASCLYSMDLDRSCGSVKRLAGSADGQWGFVDGAASRARFCRPSGVAVDNRSGQLFIADAGNSCIRLLSHSSGRVSTIAGHPHRVGCVDGPAFAATFYAPLAIALSPCPFYPEEHEQVLWIAGGYRQGLRKIVRCDCRWTYETS